MRVSWRNTPTPVDIAIVYPLGSLPASKESVWFRDILDRGATKICLVTWIDKEDVSWVNGSNPVRVTYDDDREDHHWNTLNMEHRCRVIQILCDHCGRYWGQLNQPHPGDSTIRNAKTGEYRANCLKCAMETTKFYFRFPA